MSPSASTILEGNIALLEEAHPELGRLLRAEMATPEGFLPQLGKKSLPTAEIDGLLLHSTYDPVLEAQKILEKEHDQDPDACVFLGFGLGYLPEAFATRCPDSHCIVVEPDMALFKEALKLRPLGILGESPKVHWVLGAGTEGSADAMLDALETISPHSVSSLRLSGLSLRYGSFFQTAKEALERYSGKVSINNNTLKRFGRLWVRNLSRNLDSLMKYPGITKLEGVFRGFSALVIAAGPSLDSCLPLLPRLAERMVLICVDTALGPVRRAGVDPDFVLVVDPQYWNTRHLDRMGTLKGFLITESAAHPRALRLPSSGVFLAASLFPLSASLEEACGVRGRLGAGGSVATSAWDFARFLGASPIVMAGMDLGFPGGVTHAKGSFFEELALLNGRRLSPAEKRLFLLLHDAWPSPVPANDGGFVLSDKRMILYTWWFESRMRRYPETKTLNGSEHGTRIPGMPFTDISNFLNLPSRRKEIEGIFHGIRCTAISDPEPVLEACKTLTRQLRDMEALALEALGLVGKARERLIRGENMSVESIGLDRLEEKMKVSRVKEIISFLLPSTSELVKGRAKDLFQALEFSERVYRESADSAAFHADHLERFFNNFTNISKKLNNSINL